MGKILNMITGNKKQTVKGEIKNSFNKSVNSSYKIDFALVSNQKIAPVQVEVNAVDEAKAFEEGRKIVESKYKNEVEAGAEIVYTGKFSKQVIKE